MSWQQSWGWQWRIYNGSYLPIKVSHMSYLQECVWNHTQCVNCQRMGCLARKTSCHLSFTLQPCRIASCESVVKSWWQNWRIRSRRLERDNQPAVCQVSFNGSLRWCLLPLQKSRKWRKHSETNGSAIRMFCHFAIAWRATWNGRICVNNFTQVNNRGSYALETTE